MTTTTRAADDGAAAAGGSLEGRRLVITGASSGIGEATARAAVAAGAQVALLARRADVLTDLADDIGAVAVPADVVDVEAVHGAVDAAAEQLGGLDGVVNAAGLARPALVADADPADWRAMFEVNVLGLLHVTQAAIAHLRAAGGPAPRDIVNVSSMSGRRLTTPQMGVYAASKAAVHAASEGLRRELQPDRIRVTVLAPGFVATPIFEHRDDELSQHMAIQAQELGIPVTTVADTVVTILAAPAHVNHVEVALLSAVQ